MKVYVTFFAKYIDEKKMSLFYKHGFKNKTKYF